MTTLAQHDWQPDARHDPGPPPERDPDIRTTYLDPDTLLAAVRQLQLEVRRASAAAEVADDDLQADIARRAAVLAALRLANTLTTLDQQLVAGNPYPAAWST